MHILFLYFYSIFMIAKKLIIIISSKQNTCMPGHLQFKRAPLSRITKDMLIITFKTEG